MGKITTLFDVVTTHGRYYCIRRLDDRGKFYGTPADSLDAPRDQKSAWDYPVKIEIYGPHDIIEKTRRLEVRRRLESTLVARPPVAPDAHLEAQYDESANCEF